MSRNAVDRLEIPLNRIRPDGLPENMSYEDRGCGDGCTRSLECPFARCRFDDPLVPRAEERDKRDQAVVEARTRDRLPANLIAKRFGLGRRTVYRILEQSRARTDIT